MDQPYKVYNDNEPGNYTTDRDLSGFRLSTRMLVQLESSVENVLRRGDTLALNFEHAPKIGSLISSRPNLCVIFTCAVKLSTVSKDNFFLQ